MCAPYLNFCHELKDVAKLTRCVSREQFAASQHYGIVCGFHILPCKPIFSTAENVTHFFSNGLSFEIPIVYFKYVKAIQGYIFG